MHDNALLDIVVARLDHNLAPEREFERVFHQIDQNLFEPPLITEDLRQIVFVGDD